MLGGNEADKELADSCFTSILGMASLKRLTCDSSRTAVRGVLGPPRAGPSPTCNSRLAFPAPCCSLACISRELLISNMRHYDLFAALTREVHAFVCPELHAILI